MYCLTGRLVIRSFRAGDIGRYWAIVRDPRVVRFFLGGRPHEFGAAAAYVRDCIARERASGITRFAVVLRESRALIGFCGFKQIGGEIDFGYRYAAEYWGRGIATEAGRSVLHHGQARLGLGQVNARVALDNVASAAVLGKLGFVRCDASAATPGNHVAFVLDAGRSAGGDGRGA